MNRRGQNLVRRKHIDQQAYAYHISYRVQGAYLMEMNLIYWHTMGMAFRLGNELVHRQGIFFHLLRQLHMGTNEVFYFSHSCVVVMAFPM